MDETRAEMVDTIDEVEALDTGGSTDIETRAGAGSGGTSGTGSGGTSGTGSGGTSGTDED